MTWLIKLGYFGLFAGTFLAGTIIPISSDIMLISAFALKLNPWLCLIAATIGNWFGLMTTYFLGWLGKWEWLDRWFHIKKEKLEKQKKIINKYGLWIAVFTWIPIIGIAALVALGFYKVRVQATIIVLLLGCFARFLFWTILYVTLGQQLIDWVNPN